MNYKSKQKKAKLESWYIAHKLGIKLDHYISVRLGKRSLAKDKLDLFLNLVEPSKKEYINQNDEKRKIDEWFNNNDEKKIKEKLKEFKIEQTTIAQELGVSRSNLSRTITRDWVSESSKAMLYYYLSDENNKRYIKEKTNELKETVKNKTKLNENKVKINEKGIEISNEKEESLITVIKPSIMSFVKKEDYDRIIKEKEELKEELARYKYLIDLIRKGN